MLRWEHLNNRLEYTKGIRLAIRLGIHTGLVVVGDMGEQGRQEQLALGEVPNVCSRIEGLAAPNTVAVSEATYRLVQGYFDCQDLGAQALRGVAEPMHIYHVLTESGATSRLDMAQPRGLTPLVGREQKSAYFWNGGSKRKLDTDRWSYSRVTQALARVVLCRCSKSMLPRSPICAGNVGVRSTIRTQHCFL